MELKNVKRGRPVGSKSAPSKRRLFIYEQKKSGKTYAEIAELLGITPQAVQGYFRPDGKSGVGECSRCGGYGNLVRHHPDYGKPSETIKVCPSCHWILDWCIRQRKAIEKMENPDSESKNGGKCRLASLIQNYCTYTDTTILKMAAFIGISTSSLYRFIHGKAISNRSFVKLFMWAIFSPAEPQSKKSK